MPLEGGEWAVGGSVLRVELRKSLPTPEGEADGEAARESGTEEEGEETMEQRKADLRAKGRGTLC